MAFGGLGALPAMQLETGYLDGSASLGAFRSGEADGVKAQQRALMKNVGQHAATGNYLEAARTAMRGGDVQAGVDISNWDMGRRTKAIDFLNDGASRADTPEKWNALIGVAEQAFGPELVGKYRDFNSRPNAMTALQSAQLQIQQAEAQRQQEQHNATMRKAGLMEVGGALVRIGDDGSFTEAYRPTAKQFEVKEVNGRLVRVPTDGSSAEEIYAPSTTGSGALGPYKDAKQLSDVEEGIRKEFTSQNKDYSGIREGYRRIQTGAKIDNGAGDLAIVYGYMKMLDPTSVVREGEFATAENTTGIPSYIMNLYNKAVDGSRLPPEARERFEAASRDLYSNATEQYDQTRTQYEELAKRKGIDPQNVIIDQRTAPTSEAMPPRDKVTGGQGQIPPGAVQFLRGNPKPEVIEQFEQKYGPGSAQQFLQAR